MLMAREVGFPLVVRPSYVLGGRAMEIVFNEDDLRAVHDRGGQGVERRAGAARPLPRLAIEVDVDAVCDGEDVLIGGIMEHIEQAGVHSGDSALLAAAELAVAERCRTNCARRPRKLAKALNVVGLMNVQFAIQSGGASTSCEVNPRASRTVPFVSKATGVPLAKVGGPGHGRARRSREQGVTDGARAAVLLGQGSGVPVHQVPGGRPDPRAGNEVDRRGDGHRAHLRRGYAKAQAASGRGAAARGHGASSACATATSRGRSTGRAHADRAAASRSWPRAAPPRRSSGRRRRCRRVNKVREGRPHIVDMIKNDEIALIVNTTEGKQAVRESRSIRREAVAQKGHLLHDHGRRRAPPAMRSIIWGTSK